MILKSQMQALVAQQPSGNKILHHQKNKLSSTGDSQGLSLIRGNDLDKARASKQPSVPQSMQGSLRASRIDKKEEPAVTSRHENSSHHHKRVKSDAVETRQNKIIGIVGPINNLPSVSFKNLPVKDKTND
jgi:hypothetical protein